MGAVWTVARSHLRRRRGATFALTLLVGLAGGVAVAAIAGASRTSTAMQRFVAYNRPEDVFVIVNGSADETPVRLAEARARLLALPQVRDATRRPYIFMSPDREGAELGAVSSFAAADAHAFRTMNRPLV